MPDRGSSLRHHRARRAARNRAQHRAHHAGAILIHRAGPRQRQAHRDRPPERLRRAQRTSARHCDARQPDAADPRQTDGETMTFTRRRALGAALLIPLEGLAQTCGVVTPRQTEGPFYTPNTPKRISLVEPGSKAPRFLVAGTVLSADCKPVPNALLDFWHSDEQGQYDNRGFRYRGHQFADSEGRYRLETIVPAEYPGRTRHIHVKVQAPGGRILTTQLYFPGDPGNRRDGLYRSELEMKKSKSDETSFDFVVPA